MDIFRDAKVLITGHTGFKGAWLSLWLTKLGAQVAGVSNGIPTSPSHFNAAKIANKLLDTRLDIRDTSKLKKFVVDFRPDFVFHLAAQALVRRSYADPIEAWTTNTMGTVNILNALRDLNHPCTAILITSDKCYDNVEWVWGYRENDRLGGPDPYSASKGAAELAIRSFVESYFPADGMVRIGVGRAGNVIGGGDWAEDRIVPDCMLACSQGRHVELRNPLATRPWQHVLEPLNGYLNLAIELHHSPKFHGEPFNFGPMQQNNHSVFDLVNLMSKYWEKVKWIDVSAQYGGPYESNLLKLNCDKALHNLHWRAVWDFERTVKETILWYRQFYENPNQTIDSFSLNQIDQYSDYAMQQGVF
jgi:CDP-glucose 4,6-dehydratase